MAVLVGKEAPNFTAAAVMPDNTINSNFVLWDYLKGKVGVLFFYPLDFTFVCPSEIIALNNKLEEFHKREVEVITVSVDSQFTHMAYKNTPVENGGIGQVKFPMVSDLTKEIARSYDVLYSNSIALRGTFIIDKMGVVRHQTVNDLPLGRSVSEIIRIIDALEHYNKHGEVCPANWETGKEAIKANNEGIAHYLKNNSTKL